MPQDYPIPRYHFQVDWGGSKLSFTEVTGLVMERGEDRVPAQRQQGLQQDRDAGPGEEQQHHLEARQVRGRLRVQRLARTGRQRAVEDRRDVTIRLLNEKHEPVAAWTAARCFPTKVTAPDLKSDANEAAIESLEIAHEGLKLLKI